MAETAKDLLTGEVELVPVQEAIDPAEYQLIMVCFWLQAGIPDPNSHAFLKTLEGANLFLIATHGAAADSPHAMNAMAYAKRISPTSTILGTFNCQGEVNPDFLKKARQKDPQPPWIVDAPAGIGHPDSNDLARLKESIEASLPAF